MRRTHFIVVLVIILVSMLVGIGVSYSASPPPLDTEGPMVSGRPTFVPIPTFGPLPTMLSLFVDIPDPNLDAALHQELGKPMSVGIYYFELAGLTGTLYLENKDIADAEGLQYCTSITNLVMNGNSLSSLPPMDIMAGLETVSFQNNDFTELPCQLCNVPNLRYIDMSNNPMTDVGAGISVAPSLKELRLESCGFTSFPENITFSPTIETLKLTDNNIGTLPASISSMPSLKKLYMANTGLSSLPDELFYMTDVELLDFSDNNISSLSTSINGMSSLEYLFVNNNGLKYLPDEICSLSHLKGLFVDENSLYALPTNIGSTSIEQISARENRISHLPSSIGSASNLYLIDVMVNRLKELPSSFDDKSYDFINVEFNFIDMSPGSDSRTIIDNTTSFTKYFERQLKPIEEVIAQPAAESITLSWDAGEDGSGSGGSTWNVDSYNVYLIEAGNTFTKLEELLPTELSYEHTGLTPETTYLYRVGVDYHVVEPGHGIDTIIRAYTEVEPTTLALSQASPSPSAAAETDQPDEDTDEDTEAIDGEDSAASDSDNEAVEIDMTSQEPGGLPAWAIIVICILGAGVIGTGVTLIIMKTKGSGTDDHQKRA